MNRALVCFVGIVAGGVAIATLMQSRSIAAQAIPTTLTLDLRDAPISEMLSQISKQLHVPVVLDGHTERKVSIHFSGPSTAILPSIARVLDLELREGKNDSILFVQKFDREPGIAQADPAEIGVLAQNALKTLPVIKPDPDHLEWGAYVRALAGMLDPSQVATLKSGKVVTWNDLNPAQRSQLTACINGRIYGGPRFYWTVLQAATSDPEKTFLRLDGSARNLIMELPPRTQLPPINLRIRLAEGSKP